MEWAVATALRSAVSWWPGVEAEKIWGNHGETNGGLMGLLWFDMFQKDDHGIILGCSGHLLIITGDFNGIIHFINGVRSTYNWYFGQ